MAELKCTATKKNIANDPGSVVFPCPMCATTIVRSKHARATVAPYKCTKCEFVGPN
jgi:predicted RNA-binding Zn-ribbon protein involved in translation (DUF1610 family)